jgi:hypothetical protein
MKRYTPLAVLALAALSSFASASITIGATNIAFTDISGSGTSVGTIADDSEHVISGATLSGAGFTGNALLAAGVDVRVGNNGGILWGNSLGDTFTGATNVGAINSTTFMTMAAGDSDFGTPTGNGGLGPRQFLAVLWDDNFPPSAGGGSIRFQVIGGDLFIQWTNQDHFNAQGTGLVTYQAVIRSSGPNLVDFVYQDTQYTASQYQNDGGSATIGYKNWGINAFGNDVEFGTGGGQNSLTDPAFNGANMQPKVAGWIAADNPALTHSVSIQAVPEPATMAALGVGIAALLRRRKKA